jgi:hypothetical protein
MTYTLSYYQQSQGWVSFYSYSPDYMIGMNNYFYSFKGGNIYRHNTNEVRNNFYGEQYTSRLVSVINDSPIENKLFKTLTLDGDDSWSALLETDLQYSGVIDAAWFERKEAAWFGFIRTDYAVPAPASEYPLRSVNGIGRSASVVINVGTTEVSFSIAPLVQIGSILSVGDLLYFAVAPYDSPQLAGRVTDIVVNYRAGENKVVVDTTIPDTVPISGQTPFIMYIKNPVAESHGVLGHYMVFSLENASTSKTELFAVSSEVMKSYP